MPMNGTVLGQAMAAMLESNGYLADGVAASEIEPLWIDICNEVLNHIVANAVISTTTTGNGLATLPVQVVPATGTGATTAPDVVTGTGTGTIA